MILKTRPDLTVLIVSWNTCELTLDCLRSLESANRELHLDIVVVDNNSQDSSVHAIQEHFPYVRLVENRENRGFAAAVNQGFDYGDSDYVLLLNPDAKVGEGVLQAALEHLRQNPDLGALGSPVLSGDGRVQAHPTDLPRVGNLAAMTLGVHRLPGLRHAMGYLDDEQAGADASEVKVLSGCFLLLRKTALEEVGDFDEGFFVFGEETDWCKRARDLGWRLERKRFGAVEHLGSQAAATLNGRRDILLTAGLVRYHRKHGSKLKGALVWSLLLGFNASRALGWSALHRLRGDERSGKRALHFREVLKHFNQVWKLSGGEHDWCRTEVR